MTEGFVLPRPVTMFLLLLVVDDAVRVLNFVDEADVYLTKASQR